MSPQRRPVRAGEAGFTLLEIVVALVVLAVLLLTLTRGVQFGLAAFDRQGQMLAAGGRLEAVDRTLRRLIIQLDPGTENDSGTVVGTHHAMAFRAPLPMGAQIQAGPPLFANLRLSVDASHHLVLSWLPYRHATLAGPPPPPHREILLDGVDHIDVDYGADGGWSSEWTQPEPPALIRIRIVFTDGDKRRWPDIVEAPMREQPSG